MSQTKAQLLDTLVASLLPASDSSVDIGSNAVRFANIYGDTLYGNGANLTGINTDLVSDTSPQLGGNLDVNTKNILFGDSASASDDRLIFGAGSDLSIYHNGTHSFIQDSGTGNLMLATSAFQVTNAAVSETMIYALPDGAVNLYYDNSKKLETTSTGVAITGGLTASGSSTFNEDVFFIGASSKTITFDQSEGHIRYLDNAKAQFGTQGDLNIYHDGSHSYIQEDGTGHLKILGSTIQLGKTDNSELGLTFTGDGSIQLRYDNSTKFETTSGGVDVTGSLSVANHITLPDQASGVGKLKLGDGVDLQLYHNGSHSVIENRTGNLFFYITSTGESAAKFIPNGAVELYYDNSKKLETISGGVQVTGELYADGVRVGDDEQIRFGNGEDLRLYHSGSHGILNNITGSFQVQDAGTEKFRVSGTGTSFKDDIFIANDSDKINIGAGNDLRIFHDGTENAIDMTNTLAHLRIFGVSGSHIKLEPRDGHSSGVFKSNNAVELYYDNSKKFETTSTGATVSVTSGDPQLIVTGPGHALLQLKSTSGTDHCGVNFGDNDDNNAGMIQYTNSNNDMQFHTNGSEKIRLLSGGGLTFNGDTAAANALDDYEEGNWTPSFNANISTSTVTAIYTKVGRKVTAQFYVSTPGTFGQAAGAADTSLIISGLPYAASGNAFHTGVIDVGNGGAAGAYLRVSGGASTMSVLVGSGSIGTARTHLRGNTIGKGDYVIGSITYQTS